MRPLCLFIALFVALQASAQQAPFIPITGANAMPGAAALFQDSHGGMWLGGFEGYWGLRYFDGTRFTTLVEFSQAPIESIAEDNEGGIWLATSNGMFRFFQGRSLTPQMTATGANSTTLWSFCVGQLGLV